MSTFAVKVTFYVEAESDTMAEWEVDEHIAPPLSINYEVLDVWEVRQ